MRSEGLNVVPFPDLVSRAEARVRNGDALAARPEAAPIPIFVHMMKPRDSGFLTGLGARFGMTTLWDWGTSQALVVNSE